jgi:hypothetical protein
MYKKCVVIVPALFAAMVSVSTSASAKPQQVTLSGTFSRSQVKKDCAAVGGHYDDEHSYGYGCLANNGNIVNCNNRGKCTGSIPRQSNPPHTISGILHPPSGVKTIGGAKSPNHGVRPIKVGASKAGIYRSHPTDSGGKGLAGYRSTGPTFPKSAEHHESMHR